MVLLSRCSWCCSVVCDVLCLTQSMRIGRTFNHLTESVRCVHLPAVLRVYCDSMTYWPISRSVTLLLPRSVHTGFRFSALVGGNGWLLPNKHVTMSNELKAIIAKKHFGFLGSGVMAQAMVKGFLASGTICASQVTMTDLYPGVFPDAGEYSLELIEDNEVMAKKSDIIFVCVKPHVVVPTLTRLASCLADKLVISVAAGVTLDQLTKAVPSTTRILRIMPNTPCIVQAGTGLVACAPSVTEQDKELIRTICSSIFTVFEEMPDPMLSVASSITGCGPAFIYLIAEALADGGVLVGVPRVLAQKLAVNTILGAAIMMQATKENPSTLKNQVCSPGGTTIAGVHALEKGKLRATLMNAVQAAKQRNEELSK